MKKHTAISLFLLLLPFSVSAAEYTLKTVNPTCKSPEVVKLITANPKYAEILGKPKAILTYGKESLICKAIYDYEGDSEESVYYTIDEADGKFKLSSVDNYSVIEILNTKKFR